MSLVVLLRFSSFLIASSDIRLLDCITCIVQLICRLVMGNCFMTNRVLSAPEEMEITESKTSSPSPPLKSPEMVTGKKKVVRFAVGDSDAANNGGFKATNVVRLRIMVTPRELNQILKDNKHGSIEQLVDMIKRNGRVVARVNSGKGWRPVLDSIPEDD